MASFEQNIGNAPLTAQITTNPQLLNEGYPGIKQASNFQPPTDGSAISAATAPNSQLSSLPAETLLGAISHLPQQDVAAFFQGLPQNEQTQLSTFIQQNPNAQPQDLFKQLAAFPAADLATGLSLLPTADVQKALSDAQATPQGTASIGTASTGTASTGTASIGTASIGTTPGATATAMDASGSGSAGTQPAYTPYASLGTPTQASAGTDSTQSPPLNTADQVTQYAQNPAAIQAPGAPAATAGSAAKPDATMLNSLTKLSPTELVSVIGRLPQQDLATFFQALPTGDQQQVKSALAANQNPTPQDVATELGKLPVKDLIAAAGSVPASDLGPLLSDASKGQNASAPKPGGSEFPLLFGGAALVGGGLLARKYGAFDHVPDLFQKLTGRLDEHLPQSWLTKLGRGGANVADGAVVPGAEAGMATSLAGDGVKLGGTAMATEAAAVAKGASEVGTLAELGDVGKAIVVAEDVAKVVPK